MRQFIESLSRLYKANKITEQKLKELLNKNKIIQQEYDYIISVERISK